LAIAKAGEIRYTIADIPGLIENASEGKGLGLEFLRHVERTCVIAHVVDMSTYESDRDPVSDIKTIENELAKYSDVLKEKQRVIILNKMDVTDSELLAEMTMDELKKFGWDIFEVSAVTRAGLEKLNYALASLVEQVREKKIDSKPRRVYINALKEKDNSFKVEKLNAKSGSERSEELGEEENCYFKVSGNIIDRWIQQTDFSNDEATEYLSERLEKLGVDSELSKLGAEDGSKVLLGDIEFNWKESL
jgi:GTP-binding protein